MNQEEPYLPCTDAVLICHAKRRLRKSFTQAGHAQIANWLFSNSDQLFHTKLEITPSFAASLAVRAIYKSNFVDGSSPDVQNELPHIPGRDLLFVPVAFIQRKRIIGYTFGAGVGEDIVSMDCPFGKYGDVFLPHCVGRFSFDIESGGDLLIVTHGLSKGCIGIMHMQGGFDDDDYSTLNLNSNSNDYRHRTWYVVPCGNYGHRRLPGRVIGMHRCPEKRIESHPKYQFPSNINNTNEKLSLIDGMGLLEKLIKGRFISDKVCTDTMDLESGEVTGRVTFEADIDFDADNAIAVNVFKDIAVRSFYSYMSSVSNLSFANG